MQATRRGFLETVLKTGAGLAAAGSPAAAALLSFARSAAAEEGAPREVRHYRKLSGGQVQCTVCPLNCVLSSGETCFCRTRTNHDGKLLNHAFDNPCVLRVDPIEKLPLNHYLPGTQSLSLATGGCNLRCLYCQNWQQSQDRPERLRTLDCDRSAAVEGARSKGCATIGYTYTEPVAFYEWCLEVARHAREKKVRNVVATAAFINEEPLKELCDVTDAFTVAVKGFTEKFYDKVCGVKLAPVLRACEVIRKRGVWLEVVTLLIPTYNDSVEEARLLARWVKGSLGADVPLHFARFVPEYRLRDLPRTPLNVMEDARKAALAEGVKHVYLSNVAPHEGNNTFCPKCQTAVVERLGFKILSNRLDKGRCAKCREAIPGVWA